MIVFMREKDFLKKKKSLVAPKEYVIGDATDDAAGDLSKFAKTISLDGLKPPKGLVRAILSDAAELDTDKVSKLTKRFIKSAPFMNAAIGVVMEQSKSDINWFLVFKDKDFKACGNKIYKSFKKLFPTEEDVFIRIDDVSNKVLSKKLSKETQAELLKSAQKQIKKLESDKAEEEKEKSKKKKKKDKDKSKKKKKKKKDKYLLFEDFSFELD